MFIMFRHFKKQDRDQCIDRIHKINFNLYTLANGAPSTTTAMANKPPKDVTRHYRLARKHAISLYDALSEGLRKSRCDCKVCTIRLYTFLTTSFTNYKFRKMHSAVLQLEVRILGAHKSQNKMGRLNILFPILAEKAKAEEYITTLRELEFEQLENPDPKELVSHNRRG